MRINLIDVGLKGKIMNARKQLQKYERLAEIAHKMGCYKCARKWSIKAEKFEAVINTLEDIKEVKMEDFNTYAEAYEYIQGQAKLHGQKYYASNEYKSIYPQLKSLHEVEHKATSKEAQQAMKESGLNFGDRVFYDYVSSFLSVETYTGKVINKNGTPFVKLDKSTMNGNKTCRWHRGFKKAQ